MLTATRHHFHTINEAAAACLKTAAITALLLAPMAAQAALIAIGPANFSGLQTLVDYGTEETLAPIDGVVFGGVLHNFTVGGIASSDAIIDSGPGNTNNITVANIEGNTAGTLSLLFPGLQDQFGYGYALSGFGDIPGATTIELFDAADVSLGTISFDATPDPGFPGGFAGVQSSIAFLRAEVTWSGAVERFAFDNLQYDRVPVPGTLALLGLGFAGVAATRRRAR